MKNLIIDTAISIDGFKHVESVIDMINAKSALKVSESEAILSGFMLILQELDDDVSMQRESLYHTMLNVKNQFAMRNRHRHTAMQLHAITIAIAHVRDCNKMRKMKQQVESVK
jgi:hypothetical protein